MNNKSTYNSPNSWLIAKLVLLSKSLAFLTGGNILSTCSFSLGKEASEKRVRLSSVSGSCVANLRTAVSGANQPNRTELTHFKLSNEIWSSGLWLKAKRMLIWNVVTSNSNVPTAFWKVT